jgi:hypothetical protein
MSYTYLRNTDPRNRYDQIEFLRDDGSTAEVVMGLRYDLSPTELARLSPFIVLEYSALPASGDPIGVYRMPIHGNPEDGQVPIWDEALGVFTPSDLNVGNRAGDLPTGIVGGSNLIPNPSFHEGSTDYVAGANTTLTPSTIVGLFGDNSVALARSSGTGAVVITSAQVSVQRLVTYSASAWVRLGTLGTSSVRAVTISINWYGSTGLISSDSIVGSEPINGSWFRVAINGAIAPDTATAAEVKISIAGVPVSENHYVDGFQLEVGDVPTNFGLDLPTSTIIGAMLVPETLTSREISTDLIDDIVAAAAAVAAPVGLWDFPYTIDPRAESANAAVTANNVLYYRVQGKGTITKIGIHIGTADVAGTVAVGVHRNSGSGRGARPSAVVEQGSVATTPNGYREITLGAPVDVEHGDWFSLTTNSATATFQRASGTATTELKRGLAHSQTGGGGSTIPASPGTLFDQATTVIMVGVA